MSRWQLRPGTPRDPSQGARARWRIGRRSSRSRVGVREAIAYCCRAERLRRTTMIAVVVGVVLTAINQLDVILAGRATAVTAVKCVLNFLVPFVVSNLGLLSGRR